MDGLAKSEEMVFVLGASNVPWDLDVAVLRRFEKRILVPMPDSTSRAAILDIQLNKCPQGCEVTAAEIAAQTEGYSGADVVLVAKEAAMRPLRRLMARIDDNKVTPDEELQVGPITAADVMAALKATRPSSSSNGAKYDAWTKEFGSVSSV